MSSRQRRSPAIDTVVVAWNPGLVLADCLQALVDRQREVEPTLDAPRIIVVDNASDPPVLVPEACATRVTLVRNGSNRGFAAACNQGARLGAAPFLLFLNPDVVLEPGALTKATQAFASPAVGIVGIRLCDGEGRVARGCARRTGALRFLVTLLRLPRLWPALRGHLMTDWDHGSSGPVDHVTGACYLIRRDLFEALAGFDERFVVYFEDLDLSWRARAAGWEIRYVAEAAAFHAGGWATGQGRRVRLYHDWHSRVVFARKHFGRLMALVVLIVTMVVDPVVRTVEGLRRGSWDGLADAFAALWGLVRGRAPDRHGAPRQAR